MAYSANFFKLWQRAAGYVDRILKGARPAELPIEQATEVTLNINLKTAKARGLVIPEAPSRTSLIVRPSGFCSREASSWAFASSKPCLRPSAMP